MNPRKSLKAISMPIQDFQMIDVEPVRLGHIFSLTTVNLEKSLKQRRTVQKQSILSNSMCFLPPAKTEKAKKHLTESSKIPKKFCSIDWNDFLKRNVPFKQKPSEKLQEKLNEIDCRINSEANSTQDTLFFNSIKKIDRSGNIDGQLQEIKSFTLTKKENFNEIHQIFLDKNQKYNDLLRTLHELEASDVESKKIEEDLKAKKKSLDEFKEELMRENHYSETLRLMLKRSRSMLDKEIIPINGKNQDLFRINLEIKKEIRDLKQLQFEEKQIKTKIKKIKKERMSEKEVKTQGIDFMLKIYEDQQRLKKYLEVEHKRHEMFEKTRQNNLKLVEFEHRITKLKKQNILDKEYSRLNKMLEHQERKFKTIQRVTHSSKVEDILPFHNYLNKNKEHLEKTVKESLASIEKLNQEKTFKVLEYNSLFTQGSEVESEVEIKNIKEKCKIDEEDLAKKEADLEVLNQIVLSAFNTLSRLVFQLSDEKSASVEESNINYILGYCCIKIEKIIESIQSHQSVYYIESINTDMTYTSPPDFLKLLNSLSKPEKID